MYVLMPKKAICCMQMVAKLTCLYLNLLALQRARVPFFSTDAQDQERAPEERGRLWTPALLMPCALGRLNAVRCTLELGRFFMAGLLAANSLIRFASARRCFSIGNGPFGGHQCLPMLPTVRASTSQPRAFWPRHGLKGSAGL